LLRSSAVRVASAVAVVAALVFSTGTLVAQAAPAAHVASTTVNVTATEFKFTLSTKSAAPGTVVFKVTNKGKIAHDFQIKGKKTALISPGKSASLSVSFSSAGSFPYKCTVPGHAALGMKGTFKIT
jgi:uncharacterized cupredoxin-like copper-binding protein